MFELISYCVFVQLFMLVSTGGPHYCEKDRPNPCLNGATCTGFDNGHKYTCTCTDGYFGTNCESVDCSNPRFCQNGGTCLLISGGLDYSCMCSYGWTGSNCADVDVCSLHRKADIVFVVDGSLSGDNTIFLKRKEYVKSFMSKYRVGPPNYRYQFSMITFSLHDNVEFHFNTFNNDTDLQTAVDLVTYAGGPSFTGKALKRVRQDVFTPKNGARNNTVNRYLLLLTDGLSSDRVNAVNEANALLADGVRIYTIGSGIYVRHEELLDIASFKDFVFPMATNDSQQNLLKTSMFGCDECTTKVSDVAIVMDVSANIGVAEFDMQINAVTHLFQISAVGPSSTRFSYSTFADTTNEIISFNQFSSQIDLISTVNLKTEKATTFQANVSKALNEIHQEGFTALKGSRQNARQIVVLVTSGKGFDSEKAKEASERLKDSGIIVVTIGAGLNINMTNLLEISTDPAFTYIIGDDVYTDVNVLDSLRTTFVYDYCSMSDNV